MKRRLRLVAPRRENLRDTRRFGCPSIFCRELRTAGRPFFPGMRSRRTRRPRQSRSRFNGAWYWRAERWDGFGSGGMKAQEQKQERRKPRLKAGGRQMGSFVVTLGMVFLGQVLPRLISAFTTDRRAKSEHRIDMDRLPVHASPRANALAPRLYWHSPPSRTQWDTLVVDSQDTASRGPVCENSRAVFARPPAS